MEDKFTALYVMVRREELKPEDGGSFEVPVARQQEECMRYLRDTGGIQPDEEVEVYKNINQMLMDVERRRIKRVVVYHLDRLGSSQEERDGILFELDAAGVELLTVTP
ncbi:recombinase family protein [Desulfoferrobacter suflitae]|uniref:recombinase family protein n=1 Tax=Desulfoferrobacter suflitae TaxID=2865782 RepID=UPI002164CE38|nr:recombinase family protein [Desulfoferrobacter suflitae]MCK8600854.1 recombinase family protein [Desulfoferrobacter suflitae]